MKKRSSRAVLILSLLSGLIAFLVSGAFAAEARYAPDHILVRYRDASRAQSASLPVGVSAIRPLIPKNENGFSAGAAAQAVQQITDSIRVVALSGMSVDEAIEKMKLDPNVLYAIPDHHAHALDVPNDPAFPTKLWSLQNTGQQDGNGQTGTPGDDIKAVPAWDIVKGGIVTVATVDSGIDYTHPDLSPNMWNNVGPPLSGDPSYCTGGIHGCDFANKDKDPMDDYGHGTHVAGIIGAKGNNATGVTGVMWNVQLMALKFLDDKGNGAVSDAVVAIQYAINHNVAVINNSWGTADDNQALHDVITAARQAGIVITAAAGNSGLSGGTIMFPGGYPEVICVASTDNRDHPATTSSFGAAVDVSAPGDYIYSTEPNNTYGWMHGTSMATPVVSGIAALIRATDPLRKLTVDQITAAIVNGVDVPSGWDKTKYGSGRVNALKALQGIPDTTPPTVSITSPATNTTVTGTVPVSANANDNIGVAKVEFRVDGTLIATVTGGNPFVFNWNTSTFNNTSHIVEARAYDAAGNTNAAPAIVNLIVANTDTTPPDVTVNSPTPGATVSKTVPFNITATDKSGVTKVELTINNNLVATLTSTPYQYNWDSTSLPDGSYPVLVKAYDPSNNIGSATFSITVSNHDTTPPSVTITSPQNGATVSGDVSITATATDDVGVVKVELLVDGNVVDTKTSIPYQFIWHSGSVVDGTHNFVVKAYDAAGNTGSAPLTLTTSNGTGPDTTPPTVAITAPKSGDSVSNTVTISATATDNIAVAKVEFVIDNQVKSTQLSGSSPYQFAWDTGGIPGNGPHTIVVNAYDANSNKGSATVTVTVANTTTVDTTKPTISIIAPKDGDTVENTVLIVASATDNVGVTKVEFRIDNALVASVAAAPFQYSWNTSSVGNGAHPIEARAYDAAGNTASAPITVTVSNSGGAPPLPPDTDLKNSFFPDRGEILDLTKDPNSLSNARAAIYNAYGEKVAEISAPPFRWDGRNDGSMVAAGMYVVVWDVSGSRTKRKIIVRK